MAWKHTRRWLEAYIFGRLARSFFRWTCNAIVCFSCRVCAHFGKLLIAYIAKPFTAFGVCSFRCSGTGQRCRLAVVQLVVGFLRWTPRKSMRLGFFSERAGGFLSESDGPLERKPDDFKCAPWFLTDLCKIQADARLIRGMFTPLPLSALCLQRQHRNHIFYFL